MSFVLYDVETTGLRSRFDQILQFAAIRTDVDLNVIDRFETTLRLMPHVVPSPAALHVTGADIEDVCRATRPSHYDAICAVAAKLQTWSPAVFLGYNSIRFDEEFLRQALYLCLQPPYLTNTNGNSRADVLNLVRAVAVLEPGALIVPIDDGRPSFRLDALARANGYGGGAAHDAANDVQATLHLCRLVAERAPEVWSRFLRFAQRRTAAEFVAAEEAFVYFDQVGSYHSTHIVTDIGAHPGRAALRFCVDIKVDLDRFRAMDQETLASALGVQPRLVRRLRLNAAPLLLPLYEASAEVLEGQSEEEYLRRVRALRDDDAFRTRLHAAAVALEREYPPSPHIEEQIYSGFPSDEDAKLMRRFHTVAWPDRLGIVGQFADVRRRALALRLIYLERPDLLSAEQHARIGAAIAQRRRGEGRDDVRWLTVGAAQQELEELLSAAGSLEARQRLEGLKKYLAAL